MFGILLFFHQCGYYKNKNFKLYAYTTFQLSI